jgi:hypothetical protein
VGFLPQAVQPDCLTSTEQTSLSVEKKPGCIQPPGFLILCCNLFEQTGLTTVPANPKLKLRGQSDVLLLRLATLVLVQGSALLLFNRGLAFTFAAKICTRKTLRPGIQTRKSPGTLRRRGFECQAMELS